MSELLHLLIRQGYESNGGIILSVLIAIWVWGKGRSFLMFLGLSLATCPLLALIIQFFIPENKKKIEERRNRGIAYLICRFFFGG